MTYVPTVYNSYFHKIVVDGIPCQLVIHDTAGQNENRQTANELQIIQKAQIIVLVFSLDSIESFKHIEHSVQSIRGFSNAQIILVGKKSDSKEQSVPVNTGFLLAQVWNCRHIQTSTTDLRSLRDFQNAISTTICEIRKRDQDYSHRKVQERISPWKSCRRWLRKSFFTVSSRLRQRNCPMDIAPTIKTGLR